MDGPEQRARAADSVTLRDYNQHPSAILGGGGGGGDFPLIPLVARAHYSTCPHFSPIVRSREHSIIRTLQLAPVLATLAFAGACAPVYHATLQEIVEVR